MSNTEQPIQRDIAEKAMDVWAPRWKIGSSDALQSHLIDSMQRTIAAVRPMLLADAEREIAALKAEIARLRDEHKVSANVFEIMLEIGAPRWGRYHMDRCKALAEGRES